jgi:hypothetical protein
MRQTLRSATIISSLVIAPSLLTSTRLNTACSCPSVDTPIAAPPSVRGARAVGRALSVSAFSTATRASSTWQGRFD